VRVSDTITGYGTVGGGASGSAAAAVATEDRPSAVRILVSPRTRANRSALT
jgi:phosphohistidine phosphatase SixA